MNKKRPPLRLIGSPNLHKALACAALALALAACAPGIGNGEPAPGRYEACFTDVFDTVTRIVLYAPDQAAADRWIAQAHGELAALHRQYDIYQGYEGINNAYTLNQNAGSEPVSVDSDLIGLLRFSKEAHSLTGGRVNVAMGGVLELWHQYREAGLGDPVQAQLPPMELLERAAEHTDIQNVLIDGDAGTVCLADPLLRLDLGAVAKGYAVEKVTQSLEEAGVRSMLLSVGGNVRALGKRADGQGWQVGVQSPEDPAEYLCVLNLNGTSLVTSGAYQRYYTVDGKRYHHIIRPDTLLPSEYFLSVSVLCPDSGLADALSTALFNMPYEQGLSLIGSVPGAEAMWVYPGGQEAFTPGFQEAIVREGG